MGFKVGDSVVVLDDVLKGQVTEVGSEAIGVTTSDGMVFQFLPTELVKIDVDQHELTKYNDINHPLLQDKVTEKSTKKPVFVKSKNEVVLEVDLHINQLVSTTRGMDNYDMLTLQLDTAKRKLNYAIEKRISKIVFIHGVGEGVLKTELAYLFNKYPVKYYDASYQKYGLGATEVYIFQNPN